MPISKKHVKHSVIPISVPSDATLLTVAETAEVLRLSVSAIRSWILQRRIPFVKLHDKAVRIRRADVDALIAASLVPAAPTVDHRSERAA
jgi:excisionase family DNA binding protein